MLVVPENIWLTSTVTQKLIYREEEYIAWQQMLKQEQKGQWEAQKHLSIQMVIIHPVTCNSQKVGLVSAELDPQSPLGCDSGWHSYIINRIKFHYILTYAIHVSCMSFFKGTVIAQSTDSMLHLLKGCHKWGKDVKGLINSKDRCIVIPTNSEALA